MNKNEFTKLSKHDKMLLARLEAGIEQAGELLGNELIIYHDFGIAPVSEIVTPASVMNHRQKVFDKITKANSKKVE